MIYQDSIIIAVVIWWHPLAVVICYSCSGMCTNIGLGTWLYLLCVHVVVWIH